MDKLKEQYKRLFIRFHKDNGTWFAWKYYFDKYNSFDKTIDACVHLEKYNSNVVLTNFRDFFHINISTPYHINAVYKGFCNDDVYNMTNIKKLRYLERDKFLNFLKNNLIIK